MEITVLHSTESLFLFVILFYFYCDRKESEEEEIIMLRLTYSSTQVNLMAQTKISTTYTRQNERELSSTNYSPWFVYIFSRFISSIWQTHITNYILYTDERERERVAWPRGRENRS